MLNRRLLLALPALLAMPAHAQAADRLPLVLAACWQARGVRFTPAAIAARIGDRTGVAALLAVAGAAESADGEEVETAVEIVWQAGRPPSPAEPLLHRDLAQGLPLLLVLRDGRALLLLALAAGTAQARDPISGTVMAVALADAMLIGRPVIAGA